MKKISFTGFVIFLLLGVNTHAQNTEKIHYDNEKWTEYIEGNMPLVISVPHGGTILLEDVPVRDCKKVVIARDSRTVELAREIQKSFQEKYQLTPHIVICHLARRNIDQNRAIEKATCGNKLMEKPWNQFHHYIDSALALSAAQFGKTVYIDLHGHGHPNQRLELGYLIKSENLVTLSDSVNVSPWMGRTSLNNLLATDTTLSLKDLLFSETAFGSLLARKGFPATPSLQDKAPKTGERYFNGGYNTAYFTSQQYPKVFGFQIETNYKGVRDVESRPRFASAFADAMITYLETTLKMKLQESGVKN